MKIFKNIFITLLMIGNTTNTIAQYITVDDTKTAQQLVEDVLINSPCAGVSNFSVSGDTFSPGEQSYGYFNAGSSSFPFSEGIVLSTSRAKRTAGPNNNLIDEGVTAWLDDNDLEQALGINFTFNATSLEFDFVPLTSSISFDYIFASEEYQGSAPCRYSDGFAFLLKEKNSTSSYQNLAIIPNTTIPVLVTSVHPDIPGSCSAENETYFGGYNNSNAAINFNGQTVVMTAKATVIPGVMYHIKLVIADHENIRYDSAIFLGGGSFKVGTDLGPNQLIATNNPICEGKTYLLDATEAGTNSYKWFKNNVDTGVTTPTYLVQVDSGTYRAEVTLGTSTCKAIGEITIEYSSLPILSNTTIVQCKNGTNGKTFYNLTKVDNIIKNNNSTLSNVLYYENYSDAINENTSQAITNPTNFESIPKNIFASVSNPYGCSSVATVTLQISNNIVPPFVDIESCDLDTNIDGFYTITLSNYNASILLGLPPGLVVEFYTTYNDALLQTNVLPNIYTNRIRNDETLYAKIINGSDCYGIITIYLYINTLQPNDFGDETIYLCDGDPKTLSVSTNYSSYEWSNGITNSAQIQVTTPGDYTVTVSDSNTCKATKKFVVKESGKPTITSIDIDDFQGSSNSVLIHYSGIGTYEFSLDGITFQSSPLFTNVSEGKYLVQVRDLYECGDAFETIFVLDYPKFFTPNNDGYNDIWEMNNNDSLIDSKIKIYNRYGQLVYEFSGDKSGWDGKFNSSDLPSEDYWFVLTKANGKITKGHFALKR